MLRKLLLVTAVTALTLGQPAPALARSCEDICADKAAENCEKIDSTKCSFYIMGCLTGCAVGKIFKWIAT